MSEKHGREAGPAPHRCMAPAILSLALGIGANAAIFVAAKSVLIDALPYADADRLALVYAQADGALSRPLLQARIALEVGARQRSFQSLAAFDSPRDGVLGGEGAQHLVTLAWVEHNFFETLGVPAALGRESVLADDALVQEHHCVAGAFSTSARPTSASLH